MTSDEAVVEDGYVVKNFALLKEQAEWLRTQAFESRRTQADIVREALDEKRERIERAAARSSGG